MTRDRAGRGDLTQASTPVVDGRWGCCGGEHPRHEPRCERLRIWDGDFHQWDEDDPYPHKRSLRCPCGPQRVEVFPSLANPNWEGCLWKHRNVGA